MKQVRYVCTHCGRKFEAEEKDVLECPGCFWSTSVKREEDVESPLTTPSSKASKPAFVLPPIPWKLLAGVAGILVVLFLAFKILPPFFQRQSQARKTAKAAEVKKPATHAPTPASSPVPLSTEEQNILNRRVQISANRNPSEAEKKVLEARASFKTGFSERLPSQAWTLENFEEMVEQQEKFYKVPLPRSYKNKLTDHFKKIYLPAAEAFKNGDLVQARNGWIESLAVPVYSNDLKKHRAVVLTMIKPYINDTLSKIGAINGTLVEKTIREQEQQIAAQYQQFVSLIQQQDWKQVIAAADDLNKKLEVLSHPQKLANQPTQYPPAVGKVDQDLQAPLLGIFSVPPPALSDLEPIRQDILTKRKIAESFVQEELDKRQAVYDSALENIQRQEWAEAKKKLRELDMPLEMLQDASEKIKILDKLQIQASNETVRQS